MLPNSCQHCENPACMIGCPTGAIGRDPGGDVFIREALCTGCGACARACPWDNIQITARAPDAPRPVGGGFDTVATKCELCRGYDGPACVQACPTGSIFRLNPAEEIEDLRALFRPDARAGKTPVARGRRFLVPGAALAASGIAVAGVTLQVRGLWGPNRGAGLVAGVLAGTGMLALLAYALPKRRIRGWMRPRAEAARALETANRVESKMRPRLEAHLALGLVTLGLASAHAVPRAGGGPGSALLFGLVATSFAGAWTALAYRLVPSRLARIERVPALPEDFARAKDELDERLYAGASGKSDLVKKLLEKILLPYARRPSGPLLLLASGRTLREEEAALAARVDAVLEGRGKERLAGLAELTRIVVELRALPAQRICLLTLRVGLPLHIVSFVLALALLALHVATAVASRR
jgi:Fe-S-cluster-containing hydrogenase component 2